MAPNANILTSTPLGSTERLEQQQHTGDYMPSVPVIRAPSPAFTFAASRNPPILRNGPAGNNSINQSGSGRRSTSPISSTDPTSNTTADAFFDGSTSTTGSGSGSGNGMVEGSSNSQSGQHTQHPVLNRLRSQGPPPYIPVPPEAALPRLPPEYNTAIAPLGNPSSGSP
ncbi:hypothetical protein BGX23_011345 [Mortierella sp. AD031]|nr:hypothetical protein BGX23_011345 [Mortierella sp. AD031]